MGPAAALEIGARVTARKSEPQAEGGAIVLIYAWRNTPRTDSL
jgi:hypothetical protein